MDRDDAQKLEKLRQELKSMIDERRSGRRRSCSTELTYHLSRLTTVLSGHALLGYRSMYPHQEPAELLAQIDSLLSHTNEIQELAKRAREILLRPPSDEKSPDRPGFGD
jgi:hypothetical protein